jgi:hypothetical protein
MTPRATGTPLLLLATLAVLAAPWYLVGRTIAKATPAASSPVPPTGIVWGGRVFTSRPSLAGWLHRRGVAFVVWGARHPHAQRLLER